MFHLKKVVGIAVNIGFRRGGEAHHHSVEILKNRPILFENAPVAFVNDNQIEMRRGEQLPSVLGLGVINGV